MKVFFFHVPSLGIYKAIEPILVELAARGHAVTHYNAASFGRYATQSSIAFKPYAGYEGYVPAAFSSGMNLYDLGLLLLETAERMMDFVDTEVLRESPDVILHSKFMTAPKAVAQKHDVPAACLTT